MRDSEAGDWTVPVVHHPQLHLLALVRGLLLSRMHALPATDARGLCVQMQGALDFMPVPSAQLCMPNSDLAQLRRAIEQAIVAQPDEAPNDLLNDCLDRRDSRWGGPKVCTPPPGPRAKQEAAATRLQALCRGTRARCQHCDEPPPPPPDPPTPSPPPSDSPSEPADSTAEVRAIDAPTMPPIHNTDH